MHPLADLLNRLRRATVATPAQYQAFEADYLAAVVAAADDQSGPTARLRSLLPGALEAYRALPSTAQGPPAIGYPISDESEIARWPERAPIINGVMRAGEVGLLVGPPKTKKTFITLDLANSLASGGNWLREFTCPTPARCLVVDCECEPGEIHRRQTKLRAAAKRTNRYRGIDTDLICYAALRGLLGQRESVDARLERLEWTILDARAAFVIVDTVSAFLPLENENDNAEVSAIMGSILDIATRTEASILLVHHTPKAVAGRAAVDMAAGAGAWTRRADSVIALGVEKSGAVVASFRARSMQTPDRHVIDFPVDDGGVLPTASLFLEAEDGE